MTVRLLINGENVPLKQLTFSDGASTIQLLEQPLLSLNKASNYYSITVEPSTPVDRYLTELILLKSAIDNTYTSALWNKGIVNLLYLPYGRADRVFENGDAAPLDSFFETLSEVFSNNEIILHDPHSAAYVRAIRQYGLDIREITQAALFKDNPASELFKEGDVLIAPDKGSLDKIFKIQQTLSYHEDIKPTIIEAGKTRDLGTGRVTGTTLPDNIDLTGTTCWIIDDIADGGGTFIPLAEKLREAGAAKVILYVTHGIFAKGLEPFKGIIDEIYVNQIIVNYISKADLDAFNGVQYIVN